MGGLENIIFNFTFLSMIFHNPLLKNSLSYTSQQNYGTVILGVEDQRYCCGLSLFFDEVLAVLKIDRGVRLGKFSVIVPSGFKFLHEETFLFDKCVKIVIVVFVCLFVCFA